MKHKTFLILFTIITLLLLPSAYAVWGVHELSFRSNLSGYTHGSINIQSIVVYPGDIFKTYSPPSGQDRFTTEIATDTTPHLELVGNFMGANNNLNDVLASNPIHASGGGLPYEGLNYVLTGTITLKFPDYEVVFNNISIALGPIVTLPGHPIFPNLGSWYMLSNMPSSIYNNGNNPNPQLRQIFLDGHMYRNGVKTGVAIMGVRPCLEKTYTGFAFSWGG